MQIFSQEQTFISKGGHIKKNSNCLNPEHRKINPRTIHRMFIGPKTFHLFVNRLHFYSFGVCSWDRQITSVATDMSLLLWKPTTELLRFLVWMAGRAWEVLYTQTTNEETQNNISGLGDRTDAQSWEFYPRYQIPNPCSLEVALWRHTFWGKIGPPF